METFQCLISVIAPFSFDLPLAYLRGSPATIVERLGERSYHRPLVIDGQPSLLSVSQPADGADTLLVSLQSTQLPNNPENLVRPIVERMFGARTDVRPLLDSIARKDEFGSGLLTRFRGLRPVLFPDLFETIVWAIIGQQINVSFAGKCKRAFVERFGDSFTLDGESWMLFPSPERVLEITEPELAEIQFSRQKSRYILNLAHEVVEGRLDLNALYAMPAETALERLQQLKGVGRWTAEYVLMRGVGQPDVIPAGDGGLRRIIGQQYGMGRLATEHEVRAIAEAWTGWRSYFAFYLWFTLQEEGHARRTARLQQGLANGSPL